MILSYAGKLAHKVEYWQPTRGGSDGLTPGRIGTVFFFPKHSLDILKDKPPSWGLDTGYGRYECGLTFGQPRQSSSGNKEGGIIGDGDGDGERDGKPHVRASTGVSERAAKKTS